MDMMSLRRRVMVNQNRLVTATGNPITFHTPLTKPLKECVVWFTPKQSGSGTPSPENVREIVGKNGITVWQSGKNLCPELTDTDYWSINGWFDRTGTITPNNAYRMCDYQPVKPDTDYTLSCSRTSWKAIGFYDADYEPIGYKSANAIEVSSKSPSNARYYRIYITSNSTINNIQFEIGSTATEYEAYAPVETSVSFPAVGKNLVDKQDIKDTYPWDSSPTYKSYPLYVGANKTVTVSYGEGVPDGLNIYFGVSGTSAGTGAMTWMYHKSGAPFVRTSTTITTNDAGYIYIIVTAGNIEDFYTYILDNKFQVELGSTATAYEPFDNTIYGGYVDLVNGEVVAEWTKVDMGDLNWYTSWKTFSIDPLNHANNNVGGTPTNIMCDIYPSDINTSATGVGVINKNIRGRANYKHICIRDDDYTTAADFKTAVTGHYLAYKLAEPIHYPLSPRILTTLQGNNVMWSDANGDITVRYWTR